MTWLRHVIIDLLVTVCILAAVLFDQAWAGWVVVVYTPLMLVLKTAALFMPQVGGRAQRDDVPPVFFHLLYALDAGLLLFQGWWWTGVGWLLIWGLSAASAMRSPRPKRA